MRVLLPFVGLIFIAVGVPFYLERVAPNRISGFRTVKTLSDPRIWYAANKIMGWDFIVSGGLVFVVSLLLLAIARTNPDLRVVRMEIAMIFLALGYIVIHGFWSLSRM